MGFQTTTIKFSSIALRLSALLFFRFFPAHLPSITFALFAVYAPTFLVTYFIRPELEVVDDEIDIAIHETPAVPDLPQDQDVVVTRQEIEVQETVTLDEPNTAPWRTLLYGTPNHRRPGLSALTFLANLVLVGLTADALYRGRWFHPAHDLSFVRLGYVSPTEAKFLIREPDQSKMPVSVEIRIADPRPPFDNPIWQAVRDVRMTTQETDFTAVFEVPLRHSQPRRYEWRTSNNHSGQFLAPPKPGRVSDYNHGKFTFLSTSCILPRFPYNPLDHGLAIPGLRHLANKLPDLNAQFMLFLGDFIYVDVPQRFGKSVDEYRMQYRQVYASPDWPAVGQNLSWIHVLDDHEIENDWSSNTSGVYKHAIDPFNLYQAKLNPPKATQAGSSVFRRPEATWFEFTQGPASFFMLDTRSYRSSNNKPYDEEAKTMLGSEQLADLLAWLARPEPKGVQWKVIASSVPFTKNWPVNVKDTWGGFLVGRRKVLEAMWDAGARGMGVLILSGDRHEFAATRFPPPPDSRWPITAAAHEISTSPLNQFASPIPTYRQTDDEDVKIKYIPSGSSKFGSFTFQEIDGKSILLYELFIDGKLRWNTTMAPSRRTKEVQMDSFWNKFKFT